MPGRIEGVIEDLYAGVLDVHVWQRGLAGLAQGWCAPALVVARYHADSGERISLDAEPQGAAGVAATRMPARDCVADSPTAALGRRGYCIRREAESIVVLWLPGAAASDLSSEMLAPESLTIRHLLRALDLRARVAAARQHREALEASVARMNIPLLSTDGQGVVLARSSLAQRLLDGDCGVHLDEQGRLRVSASGASVVGERRPAESVLRLARDGRRPLSVVRWPQRGVVRWMVMLCDPEHPLRVDVQLVGADLGLSARESQVAIELCSGHTQAEIAARMSISINTVRSHVKSIYGKVGAHSQVALIRRIARSPASLLRAE